MDKKKTIVFGNLPDEWKIVLWTDKIIIDYKQNTKELKNLLAKSKL
jgi:hypothetical protein